ncbi:MAG: thioredoxin family protein [Caulobacteraceae bacterium]|nr:thioredoxin family protein [Caulobacteraceae bacterium]
MVDSGHVKAELVADQTSVAPGGTLHAALRQEIAPGWHTYWRNPGDSGQATTLAWSLPTGWRAGDLIWATPRKLPIGPLMDYGYEGRVLLPVAITAPAGAAPGQTVVLKAHAEYLVCKDLCVPEAADLILVLPVSAAPAQPDPTWSGPIATALAEAPKRAPLAAAITEGPALKLSIAGGLVRGGDFPDAYFFPYDPRVIDHAAPQTIERGPQGLTLTLTPGQGFKAGPPPETVVGVLSVGARAFEIDARRGPPPAGAAGLGAPTAAEPPMAHAGHIALAFAAAFLGGLILNLMPCVFPILSMKAVALARHAHGPAPAAQGLAFMAGVVGAFLALAGVLIAARAGGEAIGWGFQLQSAPATAALALVMLLAALNLSGVYEIGESLQGLAGQAGGTQSEGLLGSFVTGALAVAVAAPCTAPFMAGAIGYALTQGPAAALIIFLGLALGLAAPFTALACAPVLLRRLPRPGAWMGAFKGAMAFPMYGAAAWLAWVFSRQTDDLGLAALLAAAVLAGFAAWVYGAAQQARITGAKPWARFGLAGAALVVALGLAVSPHAPASASSTDAAETAGLSSQPFSPQRLAALRAAGKPVFVDFTAAWCVTCQVNERIALSSQAVADAFRRAGAIYMVGDWTNRDPVIAKTLADHGRAGVPLYLMYGARGAEPVVLPQILTPGMVIAAVEKAER